MSQNTLFGLDPRQEWLVYSKFAKRIGVSPEAVRKAIINDRFDDLALRREKTKNGKKEKYKINTHYGALQWEQNRAVEPAGAQEEEKKNHKTQNATARSDATLREKMANADIAEMKAQEMSGELIRKHEVEQHFSKIATFLRDKLLGLPLKLSPELMDMDNVDQIERRLEAVITESLKELADAGRSGEFS